MSDFEKIWRNQCDAARGIKERFGLESALTYLVGEKYAKFVEAADTRPELEAELPAFTRGVKDVFRPEEIRQFLDGNRPLVRAVPENPIAAEQEAALVDRLKEMLLA